MSIIYASDKNVCNVLLTIKHTINVRLAARPSIMASLSNGTSQQSSVFGLLKIEGKNLPIIKLQFIYDYCNQVCINYIKTTFDLWIYNFKNHKQKTPSLTCPQMFHQNKKAYS